MKLNLLGLFLVLCAFAVAVAPTQKAVIISFPDQTPDSVVSEAMASLEAAGGKITHEFRKSDSAWLKFAIRRLTAHRVDQSLRRQSQCSRPR